MLRHPIFYLIFLSLSLSLVSGAATPILNDISVCIEDGYYLCEPTNCPCPLSEPDILQITILSTVCIFFTLVLILGFLLVKELREQPGDFFFGFAIGEFALAVTSLVEAIYDRNHSRGLDGSEDFCMTVSLIRVFLRRAVRTYHVCYMIFYLVSMRYSLKSSKIPRFVYHIVPWVVGTLLTLGSITDNSLGKSIQGVCDVKSSEKNNLYIFELALCGLGLFTVPFLRRRLNSRSGNLGPSTKRHLRYYLRYFTFAIIILILTFVAKIVGANAMGLYLKSRDWKSLVGVFYSERAVIWIDTISPSLLTILRLNDPFMRQYWKKFFRKVVCCGRTRTEPSVSSSDSNPEIYLDAEILETRARNLSLNAVEIEANLQNKPFLYQVLQNYKIQVVYTLLASIHYHWKVDQRKLISMNSSKNDEYYNKKARVSVKHPINDQIINSEVPEIMEEVRSKNHNILPGRLTVYAPDIFQELTELDGIGDNLIDSLDLKKNYSRILKSGNMQQGGRGGEFFFFSDDNRLIIKTINNKELQVLLGILPRYKKHFETNPRSLIAKIYAVYTFEVQNPYEEFHLILMNNINGYPSSCVARKYDLKGSTVDREVLNDTQMTLSGLRYCGTMKDKDFDRYEERIFIEEELQYKLLDTIVKDVAFFTMENLIDYSLAIYLVDKSKAKDAVNSDPNISRGTSFEKHLNDPESKSCDDSDGIEPESPHSGHRTPRFSTVHPLGSIKSTKEELYYHMGIIDYLSRYDWKKRFEKFYKQLKAFNFGLDTSCQDPHTYNRRFLLYMEKIILESYVKTNNDTIQL